MHRPFEKWLAFGLSLVAAVILGSAALSYWNTYRLREDAAWVEHSHEVLDLTGDVLRAMIDAETGVRGYIISGGRDEYLQPYQSATKRLDDLTAEIQEKTRDNPAQQERIQRFLEMTDERMGMLKEAIGKPRKTREDAQNLYAAGARGKEQMDKIRNLIAEMRQAERELLQERQNQSRRTYFVAQSSAVLAAALGLLMVGAYHALSRRAYFAQQRAAALLDRQRSWLRTTLASIGDAVITTDTDGRVTFLNVVAQTVTGWKHDEALGQPLETVFHIINERTQQPVESPAARALREGTVVGLANHTVLVAKSGTEYPIDDSAAPIRDEQGTITGVVLVFRDVTARRREEAERRRRTEQLVEAEERVRSVVRNVIDGIITIDVKGTIQSLNPAAERVFGYKADEVVGQNVKMLMPEPYHSEHDAYIGNYVRTGRAKIIGIGREVVGRRKDGSTFPMDLAISEFRLGEKRFFTGLVRDITERKRAEQALKEADRRKDVFLATLAHELRNPLAPIRNAAELLRRAAGNADLTQQAGSIVERQVGQMVRLVDDLLDISRITMGKLQLRKEQVDLAVVVRSAVEACRPLIDAQSHELAVKFPAEPVYLDADPARLAQIISNLLTNSAKYTDKGGHIWLTVTTKDEGGRTTKDEGGGMKDEKDTGNGSSFILPPSSFVFISVRDTGVGIAAEHLPRIFEMFSQAAPALDRSQGGLGIGLATVRGLVELHGGTIEARSEGLGKGSEFIVRLRILKDEGGRMKDEKNAHGVSSFLLPPSSLARRRILVVDDYEDAADSLATMLGFMGHEAHTAHDGLAAIQAAAALRPDVVMLDIGLPKMNGYDAARHIRQQPWGKKMLLVALTGWGQDADKQRAAEAGFDHHVTKPVEPEELEKLLDNSRAE